MLSCGGLFCDSPVGVASLSRKNVELNLKCRRWCLFAVTLFRVNQCYCSSQLLETSTMKVGLWSYRVMAFWMTVAYPMDETRLSFIEKSQTVYEFSLETYRHPPSIHLFWWQMVYQSVLYQTNGNAPGRNYFTPMEAGLQWKSQARLSSYQWMWGRDSYFLINVVR